MPEFDFKEAYFKALNDERFQALEPQDQMEFVNAIMEKDKRTAALNPRARVEFLQRFGEKLQEQHEFETSAYGQHLDTNFTLTPLGGKLFDAIGRIPGIGPMVAGAANRSPAVGANVLGGAEADIRAGIDYNEDPGAQEADLEALQHAAQTALGDTAGGAAVDLARAGYQTVENIPGVRPVTGALAEGAGVAADALGVAEEEWRRVADKMPRGPAHVKRLHEIDNLFSREGLDWAGKMFGESMAHLAVPLITRKLTGMKSMIPAMQLDHTGMVLDEAKKQGVDLSNAAAATIGLSNAYLESLFGAEGVLAGGPLRNMYKNMIKAGTARVIPRAARNMALEGVTEVMQEMTNMQAVKWSQGEQELWNNLNDEERQQLMESFVGGMVVSGPFEIWGQGRFGQAEEEFDQILADGKKRIEEMVRMASLTAEERGAEGHLSLLGRQEMTQQEEEELRFQQLEGVEYLDKAQTEAFTKGEPVDTSLLDDAQKEDLKKRAEKAKVLVEGEELKPVVVDSQLARNAEDGMRRLLVNLQETAEADGKRSLSAEHKKAVETLHMVEVKDEAWRELQGWARAKLGIELLAYDHDGKGVGGVFNSPGVVMIKAKKRAEMTTLGLLMHEATHNLQRVDPEAHKELVKYISEAFPEEWAKALEFTDTKTYEGLDEDALVREQLAYFMEGRDQVGTDAYGSRLRLLMKAFNDKELIAKKAKEPGRLGKLAQWITETLQKWSKESPWIAKVTGIKESDTPIEVQRKVARYAQRSVELFEEVAEKTRATAEKVAEAPRTERTRPQAKYKAPKETSFVAMKDVQVGDRVTTEGLEGVPATVKTANTVTLGDKTSTIIRAQTPDGKSFDLVARPTKQISRFAPAQEKAPESPEPAPKAKTPKTPKKKPKTEAAPKEPQPEAEFEEVPATYVRIGDKIRLPDGSEGIVKGIGKQNKQTGRFKIALSTGKAATVGPALKIKRFEKGPEQQSMFASDPKADGDPKLMPERLTQEELAKVRQTDYFQEAVKNMEEGNWETVDPVAYHEALNRNIAAVTLTPYTPEQLADPKFKLFKLKGAEIYVALNGKDAVGGINNDISRLPGIASDAFMIKVIEEGAETADCFNVIPNGKAVGFLPERYARWGFRFMTTEEMPEWAREFGGKHGVLQFSEEAYLEEHSEEDLALARRYWKEMSGHDGDPNVAFLIWDPPAGITRTNLRRMHKQGKIGTKEIAEEMIFGDKALAPLSEEIMAAHSFEEVDEQTYEKHGGSTGLSKGKHGITYWHIFDDKHMVLKPGKKEITWGEVREGDAVFTPDSAAPQFINDAREDDGDFGPEFMAVEMQFGTRWYRKTEKVTVADFENQVEAPMRVGRFSIRPRFLGTEDGDIFYEWIDTYDSPDQKTMPDDVIGEHLFGGLGIRGSMALRVHMQKLYPDAYWITGYRAGGAHQRAQKLKGIDARVRRPLWTEKQLAAQGRTLAPNRSEAELGAIHSYEAVEGYYNKEGESVGDNEVSDYDMQTVEQGLEFRNLSDEEIESMAREFTDKPDDYDEYATLPAFGIAATPDEMRKWDSDDWNDYGKQYGVENLGGMSDLEMVGKVQVPGGTEGTWTFQELMWMQSQAWDPNEVWTEKEHAAIQRKLAKTLTPPQPVDPLQVFNQLLFAMLSPSMNLTANEMSYALRRVQNWDQLKELAEQIPYNVVEGEDFWEGHYDDMSKAEKKEFEEHTELKKGKHPSDMTANERRAAVGAWFNEKVNRYHGVQAGSRGGIGQVGKANGRHVAELAQWFLADKDWFTKREGESWFIYVQRVSSQVNGLNYKAAGFGGVFQDPFFAAFAAIDRHIAMAFKDAILGDGVERTEFEAKATKLWNKNNPKKQVESVDEIILDHDGFSWVGEQMLDYVSSAKKVVYNKEKHAELGEFIKDPSHVFILTDAYKRALTYNAMEGERLGLYPFAAQHHRWDRIRLRFETHYMFFPGLFKLPKQTVDTMIEETELRKQLGHISKPGKAGKEQVEIDGRMESRLKRPRPAPPGSLPMAATESLPPSAFERGTSVRSDIVDATMSHPSTVTNPDGGPLWLIPQETWWNRVRIKFQDRFLRIAHMQGAAYNATGGRIDDPVDVYLHELIYHGRVAARVEVFEEQYLQPLMRYIEKKKVSIPEFEEWLEARHTEERNGHLTEIWYNRRKERLEEDLQYIADEIDLMEQRQEEGDLEDFDDGPLRRRYERKQRELRKLEENYTDGKLPIAGMTDEAAGRILAQAGDKFDEVAELFDEMMNQKLEILHEAGLISDEQMERVSIYQHYVPLKGKDYDGDLEILLEDIGAGTGSGFDIRGDELGVSMGRVAGSRATHPIISQAVVDIEDAIVRVEKNMVGQAMLEFVRQFPNKKLYEINKMVGRRVWDSKNKEAKLVRDKYARKAPNVLAVKQDGETFYIHIKDARAAIALKNIGSPNHGTVVKFFAAANRLMAKINTTLNPEFVVSNFIRDLQTAMVHLNDKDAEGLAWKTMEGVIPAMRGIGGREFKRVRENEWTLWYDRFRDAGGKIGFFGYNDVVSKAKAIERSIRRQGPGAHRWTIRKIVKFGKLIEATNSVVENGVRLSVFRTAVESGMTEKRAAALARRLTVNFNKKGEAGSVMNAFWLFSNASLQGTARMAQAIFRSRRVQGIAISQIMASWALAAFNRAFGGEDDEDGYTYWEKLPAWQKETNAIVMLGDGDHIKIPLAYGYNALWVLGGIMEEMTYKAATGKAQVSDIPEWGLTFADSMLGAFNPLGSTRLDSSWGLFRFAVPSIAAPIADTLVNETYYGAPIMPTRSSWDHSPSSQRYFRSVNPLTRELTKWANGVTGGNEYQDGFVDLNPEVIDYLFSSYSGAMTQTAIRGGRGLAWLFKGDYDLSKVEVRDVAFLRRIYGEENGYTVSAMYYENLEEIEQASDAWENLKSDRSFDRADWKEKHGWKLKVVDDLKAAQKALRKAETQEEKDRIRKRFNRAYRLAWLSQF